MKPIKDLKTAWVLTDGSAGMENQAWGLAESLCKTVIVKRVSLRYPWVLLAPYFSFFLEKCFKKNSSITPPWPDLIIACGRRSILPTLYIRKASKRKTITIYLQNPKISPKNFDIIICPEHDNLKGSNVLHMIGAPHRVTKTQLVENYKKFESVFSNYPGPRYSVLIGGPNKVYTLDTSTADKIALDLLNLQRKNKGSLLITFSRRTPTDVITVFKRRLENKRNIYIWDFKGDNPYFALLSWADSILLTCDSVSMISEACFTTKPVYIIPLPGEGGKFTLFHKSLIKLGRVRWLSEKINIEPVKPFDETKELVKSIKELLQKS